MPDTTHGAEAGTTPLCSVGQVLREARSSKGLTPDQLADHLHIGVEQLLALETGQASNLPEPVFIKAMVRRIASHLQLDADPLVAQLAPPATPAPASSGPAVQVAPQQPQPGRGGRRRTLLWFLPVVVIGAAGVLALNRFQRPASMALATAPTPSEPAQLSAAAAAPKDSVQISSVEPSWIELERNGATEFKGVLEGSRRIDDPEGVRIYAGRPDLILVTRGEQDPSPLGPITPLQWYPLSPER